MTHGFSIPDPSDDHHRRQIAEDGAGASKPTNELGAGSETAGNGETENQVQPAPPIGPAPDRGPGVGSPYSPLGHTELLAEVHKRFGWFMPCARCGVEPVIRHHLEPMTLHDRLTCECVKCRRLAQTSHGCHDVETTTDVVLRLRQEWDTVNAPPVDNEPGVGAKGTPAKKIERPADVKGEAESEGVNSCAAGGDPATDPDGLTADYGKIPASIIPDYLAYQDYKVREAAARTERMAKKAARQNTETLTEGIDRLLFERMARGEDPANFVLCNSNFPDASGRVVIRWWLEEKAPEVDPELEEAREQLRPWKHALALAAPKDVHKYIPILFGRDADHKRIERT